MKPSDHIIGKRRTLLATLAPLAIFAGLATLGVISTAPAAIAGLTLAGLAWAICRNFQHDLERLRRQPAPADKTPAGEAANLAAAIIQGMADPVFLVDAQGKVVEANPATSDLFGENFIGRAFNLSLRHPRAVATITRAIAENAPDSIEIDILDASERRFMLHVQPIVLGPQKTVGAVAQLHEITAIRRSENMRADFVANASHELRTPLASLIGFIETLRGPARGDAAARERFLTIMEDEASRMARLIDDLLSLSRIELDEHVPPDTPVDMAGLLSGVIKLLEQRAAEKNMTLVLALPDDLPAVPGEADQLVQVFQNLIDNAIKYGRAGTAVRITAQMIDRLPSLGKPGITFAVADRGEGISAEHLPRLTERFYRTDAARSRALGGTGLGLAIVKHIVNRHRGALAITSEPGIGTTVTVSLPRIMKL
jgi:two-component system phosphate regulon sensor histidine kinase PhoR